MSVLTTPQLRAAWAPSRSPKGSVFNESYKALDTVFKAWNYRVGPNTWTYSPRTITAGVGDSLHAFGPGDKFTFWTGISRPTALAVDINSDTNPYSGKGINKLITDMPLEMVEAVCAIRTNSGAQVFGSGRFYVTIKDPMHYEHVCTPAELATGIDWSTVAGHEPPKDWSDMATEAEIRKVVGEELDKRLNPDGKGNLLVRIRDSVAGTEKRVIDLVTGKRPGKG